MISEEAAREIGEQQVSNPAENQPLSVGALKEALHAVTELGGAYGRNLSETKSVWIRVHGHMFHLAAVAVISHEGRFILVLDGDAPG